MFYFALAAIICLTDLVIKAYIQKKQKTNPGNRRFRLFTITFYKNNGAMLGFMKRHTRLLRIITLVSIALITYLLAKLTKKDAYAITRFALALILGGAASNAYERFVNKSVTDYISFNFGPEKFQNIIFNIGDFAIFAGTIITAITALSE